MAGTVSPGATASQQRGVGREPTAKRGTDEQEPDTKPVWWNNLALDGKVQCPDQCHGDKSGGDRIRDQSYPPGTVTAAKIPAWRNSIRRAGSDGLDQPLAGDAGLVRQRLLAACFHRTCQTRHADRMVRKPRPAPIGRPLRCVEHAGNHLARKSPCPEITLPGNHLARKSPCPEITLPGSITLPGNHLARKSPCPEITLPGNHLARKSPCPEITLPRDPYTRWRERGDAVKLPST